MTRLPGWLRFTTRATRQEWIRMITRVSLATLLVFIVGFGALVEVTSQPFFCGSACHIMQPYYESWKTSAHKDVSCVDCHMTPGVRGTIRAKMEGLSQVAKYFTGTAGTRPWAEIDDASCLRSGCHETRLLEGKVDFNGIKFDHKPHLEEMRRGKKLRCTSCHSQVVMGEHVNVTTSTCILCHFKDEPQGKPVGGCQGCHHVPTDTITLPGGRVYVHSEVVERGVECVSCHATVTAGDGFVPKSRCFVCHNFRVDEYLHKPEFLHQKHVTEHKVECTDCHEEMTHGYETRRRTAKLECGNCHSGIHSATVEMAEGTAAAALGETEPRVGPMLAARVECLGCHVKEKSLNGGYAGSTRVGDNAACVACHGPMSKSVLPSWQSYFARRLPEVEAALRGSRASDSARKEARHMIETVRHGKAVHNPTLARDLLDAAERLARGRSAIPERLPEPAMSHGTLDCRFCHIEPPRGAIRFRGVTFRHEPHTARVDMSCEKCHEAAPATFPQAPHGKVKLTEKDCITCHHWQKGNCASCHAPGTIKARSQVFPHERHVSAGVDCKECHAKSKSGRMMVPNLPKERVSSDTQKTVLSPQTCSRCHHDPGRKVACLKCHEKSLKEKVRFRNVDLPHKAHLDLGLECKDCHKASGDRMTVQPSCNTCHHAEEMKPDCTACHGSGPTKPVPTKWKPFPHALHEPLGIACGDCHTKGAPEKVEAPCGTCHEEAGQ